MGVFLASTVAVFAACSGGGNGDDDGASGQGGAAGNTGQPFAGTSGFGFQGFGGGGPTQQLTIDPATAELKSNGTSATQKFVAKLNDGSTPAGVEWSLDDVSIGLISSDGVFTSKAFAAGETTVRARYGNLNASATVRVSVEAVDNPGGVTPDDQGKLQTGGDGDATLRWLYPYDATVFPRGVGAPLVQLGGAKATAMRLVIETAGFRYEGFFTSEKVNQVQLPDAVWQGLVASAQPGESVKVTATTLVGGKAAGPIEETWSIAPGSLKGIVYYNTYQSPKAGGTGAVMTIKPGGQAEVLQAGCTVCHSVSSRGNRLVSGVEWADSSNVEPGDVPGNPRDSASFELKADGTSQLVREDNDGRRYSFGALTPDGALLFTNGVRGGEGTDIRGLTATPQSPFPSRLFNTDTGAPVASPSLEQLGINYALTPAFSHDGKFVAFTRVEVNRATLSVMSFDGSTSTPVFSNLDNYVQLSGTGDQSVAGWPSFLPDSKAVVFHSGTHFDTGGPDLPNAKAHLRMVELATKRVVALNALNGQRPDGTSYLPLADAEGHMNYEPTVLPVPVGGYYWVFFTSRRTYGNTIAPGGLVPRGDDIYGFRDEENREHPSPRKKLWVAAIDLNYAERLAAEPDYDPSHPAMYVTGQELEAGNMRAFAALEPCRAQGVTCESSTECCDGRSCRQTGVDGGGQPVLQCVDKPADECSQEEESCEEDGDCCGVSEGVVCINDRCARRPPIIK